MSESFEIKLERAFSENLKDFVKLVSYSRLSQGANSLVFRIDVEVSGKVSPVSFCLRQEDIAATTASTTTLEMEAELIMLASRHGVPVPKIIFTLKEGDQFFLGNGHVTEWLQGETLGGKVVKLSKKLRDKRLLATQCGQILARLHSINYEEVLSTKTLSQLEKATLEDSVAKLQFHYSQTLLRRPATEFILTWLKTNMGKLKPLEEGFSERLIHGDFRNGNLMVSERNQAGIIGVLDWEMCKLGDPYSDLSYLCIESWRFNEHSKEVGGFGDKKDLITAYARNIETIRKSKGDNRRFEFDLERMAFWKIVSSLQWCMICVSMGLSWRAGQTNETTVSMERAAISRRATESEMDCLNNLFNFSQLFAKPLRLAIPDGISFSPEQLQCYLNQNPIADSGFISSDELLVSVAQFLKVDLQQAQLPPRLHYLSKVALNTISIIRRQASLGGSLRNYEEDRLKALFSRAEKDISISALRQEEITFLRREVAITDDLEFYLVGYHLLLTVLGQMEVDQPKYAGIKAAKETVFRLYAGRAKPLSSRL